MSRIDEWVRDAAARHPERVAIRTLRERLSYGELDAAVDRICSGLAALGVRPGTVLAGFFEKRLSLPLTFLAASRMGATFAPLPQRRSYGHLKPLVASLSVGAFFTELDHLPLLSALRPLLPPSAPLFVLHGDPPVRGYARFGELLEERPGPIAAAGGGPEAAVYLNMTSGTTGQPKAAPTTHRNLEAATDGACRGLGLTEDDVHLCLFAPDAHPHEIFARALRLGGTAVLHDSMSPKALGNIVEKAGVTCVMAVPPLYDVSLRPQLEARVYRMASLRLLEAGGMPTPAAMVEGFRDRFGLSLVPVWGSTETTGIALMAGPGAAPGLLSGPVPGYELAILSESGEPVAPGAAGELAITGEGVVRSYLGQESARLRDGTFRTGDIVRAGPSGLAFLGRSDDTGKVGGVKVYPQEIEGHLEAHPAVKEAAVVFREDRARGLAPVAMVVLHPGHDAPTLTDVKRHLRGRLPSGTLPRALEVVASLPRTAAGKLDRRALR